MEKNEFSRISRISLTSHISFLPNRELRNIVKIKSYTETRFLRGIIGKKLRNNIVAPTQLERDNKKNDYIIHCLAVSRRKKIKSLVTKSLDVVMHQRLLTIVKRIRWMPNVIVILTNDCTAFKRNNSLSRSNEYDWANYLILVMADG